MYLAGFARTSSYVVAMAGLWLLSNATAAANPPDMNQAIPFSFAISGGVSLGSYESGLNWALVKYLKIRRNEIIAANPSKPYPELMSSVGASAGSINALIAALEWCIDDTRAMQQTTIPAEPGGYVYRNTIDNNLFRDLWVNVGIDEILPADASRYREGDAVLTRTAFDKPIRQIKMLLDSDLFRPDCQVPLGMTVTRVEPVRMSVAGITVENQRFMIPVSLQSAPHGGGRLAIESLRVNKADSYLGNVIYLRTQRHKGEGRYEIAPQHLLDAVLASSAYPLAFSRMRLQNCAMQPATDDTAKPHECPAEYFPRIDEFIDGGVFDNVPLGIAKALAEPAATDVLSYARWQQTARRYNYIYLDPDIRRPLVQNVARMLPEDEDVTVRPNVPPEEVGIRAQLSFLQGAVSTGRNYELYNVLRGGDWSRQTFAYACKLLATVSGQPDGTGECTIPVPLPANTCNVLLRDRLDAGKKLAVDEQHTAARCLVQEAVQLENIYYGFDGADLTADKITEARRRLIARMRLLAGQYGDPQLALSIAALNADKFGDRRILLTTRFAPITGSMLGAFGAFIDQPFREYDYYAGVYDAIHGLADFYCNRRAAYQECLAGYTRDVYQQLGIPAVANANMVFYLLATHEHPDYQQAGSPWHWLAASGYFATLPHKGNLAAIFRALASHKDAVQNNIFTEPDFKVFIKALFANGYTINGSSEYMQRLARLADKDPATWYYPITSRASTRLLAMEQSGTDDVSKLLRGTLGLGSFAVHSYIQDEESKLLIRSAAPADTWHNWLPYEIGADLRNGGLTISWLPGIRLSDDFSLDMKITPVHANGYAGDTILFSQLDLFFSYRLQGVISSVGLGPTYTYTWKDYTDASQNNIGASAYMAFLQDRLRLSVGERSFDERFAGDELYLSLSVMDIPGLVYWFTKGK